MKVIQILPELKSGGVERGTLEVGKYLVEQGHESLVISNGGRLVEKLEREGSRHIQLPVHRKSLLSLRQLSTLRQVFLEEKPDILHVRSRVPAWLTWLVWRKMSPATRPHLVSTVHGFNSVNRYSKIMTCGERVIAVSKAMRAYVLENYSATAADRLVVIPRGVPQQEIQPGYQPPEEWLGNWRSSFPQLSGKKILLLPGRITRLKGHSDFFQLLHQLKSRESPVHGLVIGDVHPKKRAYLKELHSEVQALGLGEEVTFIGHRNDLREIMAVSDIVLNLSQQPESFGRTTLEALSIGKPVVAYDHGGVREQLELVFPVGAVPMGDVQALVATVMKTLSEDKRPGSIPSAFTREEMCHATLEVYTGLIQKD